MSRLDSFIRRLTAQRACLDRAFELIEGLSGPVIELGLGNGRTFDHIREHVPGRRIVVFEREPKAHPHSTPPPHDLIVGTLDQTLPYARQRIGQAAALLHSDIGCGEPDIDRLNASLIAHHLPELVVAGGVVLSDQPLSCAGFVELDLPSGVAAGRYTFLRRLEVA